MVEAGLGETRPMAFLDRDGVINVDVGYAHRSDQIIWTEGIFDALVRLDAAGYRVVVVSNQSGIARGLFTPDDVEALHRWMGDEIAGRGGGIDAFYYCPFFAEAPLAAYRCDHEDRKPHPGMLLKALARFPTDTARSFLIGDKHSDLEAAQAANIRGFLFTGGSIDSFVAAILAEFAA